MKWLKDEDLYRNRYSLLALILLFVISFFYFFGTDEYKYRNFDHSDDSIKMFENIKQKMANLNCSEDHDGCQIDVNYSQVIKTNTLNVKTHENNFKGSW